MDKLRHDRDSAHAALTEVKVALAAEQQLCASFQQQKQSLEHRLRELSQVLEHRRAEIAAREEDLRGLRRQLGEAQQLRGAVEVELAQKQMTLQNRRERIREKYQVDLDGIRSECMTITIASEGPPRIQTLTPDEMGASGAATDWAAVAEQVAALQKRIDEIGPVNLVAIEWAG